MKKITNESIVEAVLAYFIEHKEPATAKEIAEYMNASEGAVRKLLNEWISDIDFTSKETPVRERNYNSIVRYRKTDAYQPSRRYMADRIVKLTADNVRDNSETDSKPLVNT